HRVAFGNGHDVEIDVAARDPLVNLWQTRGPLKKILARLQGWLGVQQVPKPEDEFAADYPRFFQLRGDPPRRIPGSQQQRNIGGRRKRDIELPCGPAGSGENDNLKQLDQRAQGFSVEGFQIGTKWAEYRAGRTGCTEYRSDCGRQVRWISCSRSV